MICALSHFAQKDVYRLPRHANLRRFRRQIPATGGDDIKRPSRGGLIARYRILRPKELLLEELARRKA
ncbi:MAG: hypothetical protein ACLUI3_11105 [Christensenellales bacterium]